MSLSQNSSISSSSCSPASKFFWRIRNFTTSTSSFNRPNASHTEAMTGSTSSSSSTPSQVTLKIKKSFGERTSTKLTKATGQLWGLSKRCHLPRWRSGAQRVNEKESLLWKRPFRHNSKTHHLRRDLADDLSPRLVCSYEYPQ